MFSRWIDLLATRSRQFRFSTGDRSGPGDRSEPGSGEQRGGKEWRKWNRRQHGALVTNCSRYEQRAARWKGVCTSGGTDGFERARLRGRSQVQPARRRGRNGTGCPSVGRVSHLACPLQGCFRAQLVRAGETVQARARVRNPVGAPSAGRVRHPPFSW